MNFRKELEDLQDALKKASAEITECERRAAVAEDQRIEAVEAAAEAQHATDVAAYHAAQDAMRTASDTAAMYRAKAARIAAAPLITPEEYEERKSAAFAALDEDMAKLTEEAREHIRALLRLTDRAGEIAKDGNAYLHSLQHDIFKDDACMQSGSLRIYTSTLEVFYKGHFALCGLGERLAAEPIMKDNV